MLQKKTQGLTGDGQRDSQSRYPATKKHTYFSSEFYSTFLIKLNMQNGQLTTHIGHPRLNKCDKLAAIPPTSPELLINTWKKLNYNYRKTGRCLF